MSEDHLRLGVVRLMLATGRELSVRASDIVACIGEPTPSDRELDMRAREMAHQHRERAAWGAEAMLGAQRNQIGFQHVAAQEVHMHRVSRQQPRRMVILRGVAQVYEVANSRDEIEGWMRDE